MAGTQSAARDIGNVLAHDEFILFGASPAASEVEAFLAKHGKTVVAFCDNSPAKQGTTFHGQPVVAPQSLSDLLGRGRAIIIASAYQSEIARQLCSDLSLPPDLVFPYVSDMFAGHFGAAVAHQDREPLARLRERLADADSRAYLDALLTFRQTMDARALKPNPRLRGFYDFEARDLGPRAGDFIVDVGAYTGDSAVAYLNRLGKRARILALEPLPENYARLVRTIADGGLAAQITPLPFAAGAERGRMTLRGALDTQDPRATLRAGDAPGETHIEIETLDSLLVAANEPVDFVKVDVEGFEPAVLRGAAQILKTHRPGLALAAYHAPDHVWRLTEMLDEIVPGYRIHLGHHPSTIYECEIYAVHEEKCGA